MRKLLRLLTCFSLFIVSIDAFAQQNVNITVNPQTSKPEQKSRPGIAFLYNYLKVITNELGYFETEPTSTINRINKEEQYGYNTWRLPSDEELSMLRANGYAKEDKTYMTQSRRYNGHVILVTDKEKASVIRENEKKLQEARKREAEAKRQEEEQKRQDRINFVWDSIRNLTGWCDLGLPSGTLWNYQDIKEDLSFGEASLYYNEQIPNTEQWIELFDNCKVTVLGTCNYMFTGKNGNSIIIPYGEFWMPTKDEFGNADFFNILHYYRCEYTQRNCNGRGLRIVYASYLHGYNCVKHRIRPVAKNTNEDVILTLKDVYVDLGLPSGTKWEYFYKEKVTFNHDDGGLKTPRKQHWKELEQFCKWEWRGDGYKVIGPNGNHIYISTDYDNCYYCRSDKYGSSELYLVKLSKGPKVKMSFIHKSEYWNKNLKRIQ